MTIKTSQWGNLSPTLLATLFAVERVQDASGSAVEGRWQRASGPTGDIEVQFPISEGNLDATMNWTSPFEAIGAESKAPILTSLIQSGALASVTTALINLVPDSQQSNVQSFTNDLVRGARELEGRAGITKLNSTQIFSGMQPVKFSIIAHFRAWADAASEVQAPVNQLMEWALPKKLSGVGFIENFGQTRDFLRSLFPSEVPQILGFQYGGPSGIAILPVVIENISQPLVAPRDSSGQRLNVAVQLTMTTLSAIDRFDYRAFNVR